MDGKKTEMKVGRVRGLLKDEKAQERRSIERC